MSVKNLLIVFFLRAIRSLTPKKQQETKAHPHYLIVSTTALGDTLWATPALKALRASEPKASISVLTSPIGKEVFSGTPYVDEVLVLQKPHLFSLIKIYILLRKKTIDTVFIFHTSQRAVLPFCYLLKPKEIIGTAGINKGLDTLLTKALEPKYEHEIERRLRIVSENSSSQKPQLELFLSSEDRENASSFLKKHNLPTDSLLIGLHPGAKDKFKQWPPECFIELGSRFKKSMQCSIIVTGGPSEKELTEQIASGIPDAIALTESVPLKTLAGLIERCGIFITNDTGPMHVAFAVNTPTVALFTATDSNLCGPYHAKNVHVIQKQKTCTPCLRKKCMLPFCMLQISPKEVEAKAHQLLKGSKS